MPLRFHKSHLFKSGFTLIEILVVLAIIMILAGLTVGMFQYANRKAMRDRTIAQMKVIQGSLEQYYNDVGMYPTGTVEVIPKLAEELAGSGPLKMNAGVNKVYLKDINERTTNSAGYLFDPNGHRWGYHCTEVSVDPDGVKVYGGRYNRNSYDLFSTMVLNRIAQSTNSTSDPSSSTVTNAYYSSNDLMQEWVRNW